MSVTYHEEVVQGSEAWAAMRCGLLTASEMHLIVTPTLKAASNEKERAHLYELLAQRITKYVEPRYIGDDMLRGMDDEITAVDLYGKHYKDVQTCGFITNDRFGFTIGYSPDALVDDDGLIEAKSRNQKLQMKTLLSYAPIFDIDPDFIIQVQTGLMVSERKWLDQISYCGGLPMVTTRIYPDEIVQGAILEAATGFEERLQAALRKYKALPDIEGIRLIATERKIYEEMYIGGEGQ